MVVICIGHGKVISIDREITHQIADTSNKIQKITKIIVFWPSNGCFVWQDNFLLKWSTISREAWLQLKCDTVAQRATLQDFKFWRFQLLKRR